MTKTVLLLISLLPLCLYSFGNEENKIIVTVNDYWPGGASLQAQVNSFPYTEYMKKHPKVVVRSPLPGLHIPGPAQEGEMLMQIIGETIPDIIYVYLSGLRGYIKEEFLAPMDDAIGFDKNGNGVIENEEVVWDEWWDYPAGMRMAATHKGHIYAIPDKIFHISGLCYRKDLFSKAGLSPNQPPKSYDELFSFAQQITLYQTEKKGNSGENAIKALMIRNYPLLWHPGVWDGGGNLVKQVKKNSLGEEVLFPINMEKTIDPKTGEDLSKQPPQFKATFNHEPGHKTLDFIHKLFWKKWIKSPFTSNPLNLSLKQINKLKEKGRLELKDNTGRIATVYLKDVFTGVARLFREDDKSKDSPLPKPFIDGEIAMFFTAFDMKLVNQEQLPRNFVGFARTPTPDGNPGFVQAHSQFMAISSQVMEQPEKLRICCELLKNRMSKKNTVHQAQILARAGLADSIPPPMLKNAGLSYLLQEVDPEIVELYDDLTSRLRIEPYNPGWIRALELFRSEVFDTMFYDPNYDYHQGLDRVAKILNTRIFVPPEKLLAPHRKMAYLTLMLVLGVLTFLILVIRKQLLDKLETGKYVYKSRDSRQKLLLAGMLLSPALILIALWSYYPLVKGSIMAFQEYHILAPNHWVGLDNFMLVFMNPKFYYYCLNTVIFVLLTIIIGFMTPVILALLLSEIPRGKVFFRTIFYLPTVTAGMVIMLLWKQMYQPDGLINQLIGLVGVKPQAWLNDPKWAMVCIILPGVWATVGAGSLIYLAALKSISNDLYEAADVDGAGTLKKIWCITLPTLKPLLIINFLGAFIGSFHGMGNILVMTGGGPADTTRVLALDIWIKSFAQLKFGLATAMAWTLGITLIGFTVMQLKILSKVEFRRAGS